MTPDALTEYLHQNIPLTAALGARALRCDAYEVEIGAPLKPNLNHRGTAFGGSLATLGIVSGWALLHLALRRENLPARLVIQRSECDFAESVEGEFAATSRLGEKEWLHFVATLKRYQRARITIHTDICAGKSTAVRHQGTYVALA
jgi:thioesterase domain-containing protein